MKALVFVLFIALAVNALIAFFVAFFWQAKAMLTVLRGSDFNTGSSPRRALSDPNSSLNMMIRFSNGEFFPELRRKCLMAMVYLVASYAAPVMVLVMLQLFAPGYLP